MKITSKNHTNLKQTQNHTNLKQIKLNQHKIIQNHTKFIKITSKIIQNINTLYK